MKLEIRKIALRRGIEQAERVRIQEDSEAESSASAFGSAPLTQINVSRL